MRELNFPSSAIDSAQNRLEMIDNYTQSRSTRNQITPFLVSLDQLKSNLLPENQMLRDLSERVRESLGFFINSTSSWIAYDRVGTSAESFQLIGNFLNSLIESLEHRGGGTTLPEQARNSLTTLLNFKGINISIEQRERIQSLIDYRVLPINTLP